MPDRLCSPSGPWTRGKPWVRTPPSHLSFWRISRYSLLYIHIFLSLPFLFSLSLSLSLFLSLSSFFFSFQNVSLLFPLISSFLAANSPLFGSKMKQPKLLPQKVFSLYSLLLSFSSTLSNSSLRAYLSFAIVYPVSWFLFCCFILLAFCVFISSFLSSSVM